VSFRKSLSWITTILTLYLPVSRAAAQQTPPPQPLNLVVVEGQGAIHNVRERQGRDAAVVRVEDAARQPVAGAAVTFTLPSQGAGGDFLNSEKTLVVTTDAQGHAVARGMRPNSQPGKFEMRVTASYQGQTASATVTQFNMAVQSSKSGGGSGKWIAILAIAGGGAAAGIIVATQGSSSSTPTPQPRPPLSITAGSGAVGPPQ
jgi:hypothetical protein